MRMRGGQDARLAGGVEWRLTWFRNAAFLASPVGTSTGFDSSNFALPASQNAPSGSDTALGSLPSTPANRVAGLPRYPSTVDHGTLASFTSPSLSLVKSGARESSRRILALGDDSAELRNAGELRR